MKKCLKTIISICIVLVMLLTMTCCGNDSSDDSAKKKGSGNNTNISDDADADNYDEQGKEDNAQNQEAKPGSETDKNTDAKKEKMYIINAKPFKDGYALIELGDYNGNYSSHAIIDTEGKAVSFFSVYSQSALDTKVTGAYCWGVYNNKYYMGSGDDYICFDINSREVFRENFADTDKITGTEIDFDEKNGTTFMTRTYGGFDSSGMQYALMDENGKYIVDWTYLYYDGNKVDFSYAMYCGNDRILLVNDVTEHYMHNLKTNEITKIEGIRGNYISKFLDGYAVFGDSIISEDGEVSKPEVEIYLGDYMYLGDYYAENDVDAIWIPIEYTLYDTSLTVPVGSPSFAEDVKGKATQYGSFVNGYMPLMITGSDDRKYITLIDENGHEAFEPISLAVRTGSIYHYSAEWNGENLFINRAEDELVYDVYDKNGEFIRTIDISSDDRYHIYENYTNQFQEGFFLVSNWSHVSYKFFSYLKDDGTVLFPDGQIEVAIP